MGERKTAEAERFWDGLEHEYDDDSTNGRPLGQWLAGETKLYPIFAQFLGCGPAEHRAHVPSRGGKEITREVGVLTKLAFIGIRLTCVRLCVLRAAAVLPCSTSAYLQGHDWRSPGISRSVKRGPLDSNCSGAYLESGALFSSRVVHNAGQLQVRPI